MTKKKWEKSEMTTLNPFSSFFICFVGIIRNKLKSIQNWYTLSRLETIAAYIYLTVTQLFHFDISFFLLPSVLLMLTNWIYYFVGLSLFIRITLNGPWITLTRIMFLNQFIQWRTNKNERMKEMERIKWCDSQYLNIDGVDINGNTTNNNYHKQMNYFMFLADVML